jgi:hypothetical protein
VDLYRSLPPQGTLERAPRTALQPRTRGVDEAREQWEGFWCVEDDRYYARCTLSDGSVEWYSIRDEGNAAAPRRARRPPYRRPLATIAFVSRADASVVLVGVTRSRVARPRRGGRS